MDLKELKLTPKRTKICEQLGFNTSDDVLSYYPFRYEMYEKIPYERFEPGKQVCLVGNLASYPSTFRRGKLTTTRFKVLYDEELLTVTIFNRPWIRNLVDDQQLTIVGKYEGSNKITASGYYVGDMSGKIIPYYPLKEGITQNDIKKLVQLVLDRCLQDGSDILPEHLIKQHRLIDHWTAIRNIHQPSGRDMLAHAMSRLKYEEFLRFYLALTILKGEIDQGGKQGKVFDERQVDSFVSALGFELTEDQITAKNDILKDLASNKTMYRLVQGEVGCGKTAVAMIGLYANHLAGYQGALMAPTEILARQHYESLKQVMEPFGVKTAVLYSGMTDAARVKEELKNGTIDCIVGTHALFSEDVAFAKLGLVIADEQHRFGVRQRQALRDKGKDTDFILMSATPIPRTLAASIFGDMDVTTIATLPKGRKGCKTYMLNRNSMVPILDKVKQTLAQGRQIYVVAAAIERSDDFKAKDVNGLYASLKDELKPYEVALMHGRLTSEEKSAIMERFNDGQISVLISTTVVEVGVNVKNATMMIIYDADRFGLSQLHQLRGRVQRSSYEGTCYLLSDTQDENARKRLQVLCDSNDGFEIAMQDLKLRGPGDILGTRQSGVPAFILGNIIEDTRFIDAARKDAALIAGSADEQDRNYYEMVREMTAKNFIG